VFPSFFSFRSTVFLFVAAFVGLSGGAFSSVFGATQGVVPPATFETEPFPAPSETEF
jgi:hypothetical protein